MSTQSVAVSHPIPVAELFRQAEGRLRLTWVAGREGGQRLLTTDLIQTPPLVAGDQPEEGHPDRVLVLGTAELEHLRRLPPADQARAVGRLFSRQVAAVVVAGGTVVPPYLVTAADRGNLPLFSSPESGPSLIRILSHTAGQSLAPTTVLHGVFLEVLGLGVLLTGDPAIGKSELALALITRGHRLVADDVLEVRAVSPDALEGRCPVLLRDYMEVRGLGLLDIRSLFGETAVKYQKHIKLIIHLTPATQGEEVDRLDMSAGRRVILGVAVPEVQIPVAAGRNLAVLVEVAVRNHILKLRGNDPTAQFVERQRLALAQADPEAGEP